MKTALIRTQAEQQPNLLVYFAGWGTPLSAVSHLTVPKDYELLICYDYQNLQLDFDFSPYADIRLVAWSMGVWVANQTMQNVPLRSATAVNGTGQPCHDEFGIPCEIFRGTLAGLDEANRTKFERRICGDKQTFAYYQQLPEQRQFPEIHAELTALYAMMQHSDRAEIPWTHAVIAKQDRIFPAANQLAYWQARQVQTQSQTQLHCCDGAHYVFLHYFRWAELWEFPHEAAPHDL